MPLRGIILHTGAGDGDHGGSTAMSEIYRITASERIEGQPTRGIRREQAVRTDGMWGGLATTEPGTVSGWHHHAGYESTIYVISGAFRMEFGPGGTESFDAGPGDFVFVGRNVIHRRATPPTSPAASSLSAPGPASRS
jgi:uncharacterized RmlC-like cupin family protein